MENDRDVGLGSSTGDLGPLLLLTPGRSCDAASYEEPLLRGPLPPPGVVAPLTAADPVEYDDVGVSTADGGDVLSCDESPVLARPLLVGEPLKLPAEVVLL